MPHNFDYLSVIERTEVGAGGTFEDNEVFTVGPDADEVWDILSLRYATSLRPATADVDGAAQEANAAGWVHTGLSEPLIDGVDVDNTGFRADDPRVLAALRGGGLEPVEDTVNGLGHSGLRWREQVAFEFAEGDLRIAFPGELGVGSALNAANSDNVAWVQDHSLMVHYRPSPRHG